MYPLTNTTLKYLWKIPNTYLLFSSCGALSVVQSVELIFLFAVRFHDLKFKVIFLVYLDLMTSVCHLQVGLFTKWIFCFCLSAAVAFFICREGRSPKAFWVLLSTNEDAWIRQSRPIRKCFGITNAHTSSFLFLSLVFGMKIILFIFVLLFDTQLIILKLL